MDARLLYYRLGCVAVLAGMMVVAKHSTATAQTGESTGGRISVTNPPEKFWTPSRIQSAEPSQASPGPDFAPGPLPDAAPPAQTKQSGSATQGGPATLGGPEAFPRVPKPPGWGKTLAPPEDLGSQVESGAVPGSLLLGYYFTTSRVFPPPEGDPPDAAITSPYSRNGKFFHSDPRAGSNGACTASLIGPTLIVTAGHCVSTASTVASGRYFHTNLMFVPAFTNGSAPFNAWSADSVLVNNAWFFSDGSVPNPADYALVRLAPISGIQPGAVIGFHGWATNALANNDVTQLGYPGNLDGGNLMEVNHSKIQKSGGKNTYIIGSAMGAGASGGPWLQDFGVQPVGAPPVTPSRNLVVGVSSYFPGGTTVGSYGASQFDARFVDLLHGICGSTAVTNC
jgi:hypothetical protein